MRLPVPLRSWKTRPLATVGRCANPAPVVSASADAPPAVMICRRVGRSRGLSSLCIDAPFANANLLDSLARYAGYVT